MVDRATAPTVLTPAENVCVVTMQQNQKPLKTFSLSVARSTKLLANHKLEALFVVAWCRWSAVVTDCYHGNTGHQVSLIVTIETRLTSELA